MGMSEEDMALKCTKVGDSYRVRLLRRIPCPECGVDLTVGSMMAHHRRIYVTEPATNWIQRLVIQTVHQPQVYDVILPQLTKL